MNNSSVRNITLFLAVLGTGIYFLRPSSAPSVNADLKETKKGPSVTSRTQVTKNPVFLPRAPSSSSNSPIVTDRVSKAEKDKLVAELRTNKQCYVSEICNFPHTDPHSYSFALGRKISQDLTIFQKTFAKRFPEEARALALEFSSNEDGFVQEAALKILHELPPTKDSLNAVAQVVNDTTDPSIVTLAMDELKRYVGSRDEAEVHQALARVLSTGGLLTSQKASQGLLPFINANSVGYYQKVLKSLAPDSEVARNLKISLIEYQRMSTGG